MRNNVMFRYEVSTSANSDDEDPVLSVQDAAWFIPLLRRIDDFQVNADLCQEDWGVVAFGRRGQKNFWIGLSYWPDVEHT